MQQLLFFSTPNFFLDLLISSCIVLLQELGYVTRSKIQSKYLLKYWMQSFLFTLISDSIHRSIDSLHYNDI